MDTDDHPIEVILKEARRFMVPLYQRKYQWTDKQLVPFWDDLKAKAREVLDDDNRFQHYMGALILSPVGAAAQIGITPKVQVIDGQQRLTTFQLFLAALREVARQHGCSDVVEHVQDYLFNSLKSKDRDPLTRFKLTPTPSDRVLFQDIVNESYSSVRAKYRPHYWGNRVPKNTQARALRAYDEFHKRITTFAQYGPLDDEEQLAVTDETDTQEAIAPRLEALLSGLLARMKLVVIVLGEDDDAQVIFETLNSKGEPLLAMDLVRNNIFHRAERERSSIDDLYRELWDPFDAYWWREPAPSARPRRPRIDHFLAHSLAAETGSAISMRELYAEYRQFAVPKGRPRFASVEDELRVLRHYAPLYETLEGRRESDQTLVWLGRKFSAWQITTAYPVAMQLMHDSVSAEERHQVGRLLYAYIVRRWLSGLTMKNLNKVFQSLAQVFAKDKPSVANMKSYFSSHTGASIRYPTNDELCQGIATQPVYFGTQRTRLKDILWELEIASRSALAEKVAIPDSLWIEHVLPVSWNEAWPFVDEPFVKRTSEERHAIRRNRLIHTLGNLTLLSDRLNISAGNASFEEKNAKFTEHSGLFLNKWFRNRSSWAEPEILERSEHLAQLALTIWPDL